MSMANSPRHSQPIWGMSQNEPPTSVRILYSAGGFFGARGNWLELDEGAAAIWWAEEPPHDVHGPG